MMHQIQSNFVAATLETLVGTLVISADRQAITGISFAGKQRQQPAGRVLAESSVLTRALRQLEDYFSGRRRGFDLPVKLLGTPFQLAVWQEMGKIPFGSVLTYGELAQALGSRNLARAVGQAANRNPVPIIVPCHRVVAAAGGIGGFAPGIELKYLLLRHENAALPERVVPR